MLKCISINAYLFFCAASAIAQQIPFVNYTPKEGLVNNRVKKIAQDNKGQLFFLTFGGLSIYDGTGFTNFTKADGLASDVVNDAVEMGADSVWIATNTNGLNYFSKSSIHKFKTADGFCPIINSFYKNKEGQLFAACDEGLFIFKDNRFTMLPVFKDSSEDFLNIIFQAGDYLLIATDLLLGKYRTDLLVYNVKTKTIVTSVKGIACTSITEIEGDIWLACTKEILIIDKQQLQQGNVIFKPLPLKFQQLKNNAYGFVFYDSNKNLWASQSQKGLLKISTAGTVKNYTSANGLLSNNVAGLYEDRESALWFINDNYGVQKLVSNNIELISRPFGSYIQSLAVNSAGDSVYYWDMLQKKIFLQTTAGLKIYTVKNIGNDFSNLSVSGNNLYLNSGKTIYHFTIAQLNYGVIAPTLIYAESVNNMNRSIIDANGIITIQGIYQLNTIFSPTIISKSKIKYYIDEGTVDSKGRLWFVSRAGELYVMKTNSKQPENYLQLLKDYTSQVKITAPRSVTADKFDNIWVGTREDGLYCFKINENMELQLLKHISKKEGLTASFITFLYCDKAGAIWAGTSSGIDKITWDKDDVIIDNISKRSNLYPFIYTINEDNNHNILALTADGGLVKIAAEQNNVSSFAPQLFIKNINAGNNIFSGINIPAAFSYKQNNISIHVASPSFYDEKQIKYSYILEGSGNSNWSDASTNAVLSFINLSPASYTLKIKATYPASRYTEKIISYSFSINPPWWQTWWFKILMSLLVVGILILMIRSYYKRKLEKQKIVLEKQQAIEKERSRIASDIHDDLGAGLSTIRFLSEKVKRNSFSDTTKLDAEKIVNNSNELVQKMNELIWAMNEKNDTLEDLLFYARSYAAEYGEENNLQMHIFMPEKIPEIMVAGEMRRNVFLTLKESLHNIVKHAGAKKVIIKFNTDKNLSVIIKDDGKGFENINKEGNGLKNMKKRIDSIGGFFEIINDGGVTVNIRVPLK
ncbi:sensor histidine kinase [Ferruginibacter sp.]